MRILSVISLILACFSSTTSNAQIIGPISVCENECHNYTVNTAQSLYWTVTGGLVLSNNGTEVEICWEEAQIANISVQSLDDQLLEELSVTINEEPQPEILFPLYPNCNAQDSLDFQTEIQANDFCQSVCGGGVSFLEIANPNASSNYTWIVTGDTNNNITPKGIEIQWPVEGYGSVTLVEESNTGCVDSSYTCIKILEKPSLDITLINNQIDLNNVCQNQNIYLSAVSDQNLNYQWQSSDGQNQEGLNSSFSFGTTGVYEITLTGFTDCFCIVETSIQVMVIDFTSPTIECLGTICANEETTYFAADICGNYNWSVGPNGTIVDGGQSSDNFITVNWNSGPLGTLSLSTSSCDDPAICTEPVVELIPIMGSSVTINGPDEVCNNETSIYTTQQFQGANYVWDLAGNGFIINGNGTNEITVQWNPYYSAGNTADITVSIESCYWECNSQGEKEVSVEAPFAINSRSTFCENESGYFISFVGYDGANADWSMVTPDNQIINLALNETDQNIDFIYGPGIYEIIAIAVSDDYCNKEERTYVEVFTAPKPVTSISGSEFICIGEFNRYAIENPSSVYDYTWTITDGPNVIKLYGSEIFHQWLSTGPYTIEVTATDRETSCISDLFTKEFFELDNANINGTQTVCSGELSSYVFEGIESNNIEWTVIPDDAGIPVPQSDNNVNVLWLKEGTAVLTASYCGKKFDLNIDVIKGTSGYNFQSPLCPGETTDITLDPGISGITVTDESGNIVGTSDPVNLGPGHYELATSDSFGCPDYSTIYIEANPEPAVHVSSRGLNRLCDSGGQATLDALTINAGLDYTWYQNGINLNINAPSILASDEGLYRVEVIDGNGCESSDAIQVECVESMCMCRPDGGVRYSYQRGAFCNQFDLTNTSFDYIPGSLIYNFDDPGSVNNITTEENPSHEFSQAGHYVVILNGIVPHATIPGASCAAQFVDFITVEAVADFESSPSCAGQAMEFFENANFLPDYSIDQYGWDFGDPGSGPDNASTLADPVHIFTNPGEYDVSLTITSNTGCKSIKTKKITVHSGPSVDFDIPMSTCVGEVILFNAITDAFTVQWDFNDAPGETISNEEAYHIYDTPGIYQVTLSGWNIYDCLSTITRTITVVDNSFVGGISMDKPMPMCDGESVTLTGPVGGFAYLWSTGETTPDITTTENGIYKVTVTSNDGCQFIPESVIVNTIRPINPLITGYKYDGGFDAERYYNEMEICEGEDVSLGVQYIFNADYQWSTGSISSYLSGAGVSDLPPGEHVFTITVTEPTYNCAIEADPFTIIVHPLPPAFQIVSDQAGSCEGLEFTFSVENPDPALDYYWNNGMVGTSISVVAPGNYYADAYNQFGCSRSSNVQIINALPDISRVLTGCLEVCFPETLCVSPTPFTNYTWYLDGVEISGANQNELVINDIGDYQVELESNAGCSVISDLISISPETNEQALDGIVFLDANGDGLYDTGDELIIGASVNIISGSTVLASTTTDVNGAYLFDPAPISNALVVLDTFGLGLNLSSSTLLYSFELRSCDEELTQDFPLNKICVPEIFNITLFTCPGEMAEYEGVFYTAGENASITVIDNTGCESTINLEVFDYQMINYQLMTFPTCENQDDGVLVIEINSGNDLQFSIDNGLTFTPNPEINNLASGNYTLQVMDINGCITTEDFTIDTYTNTPLSFVTSFTCPQLDEGSITIDNSASANMEFAIDDNSSFSQASTITNLSAGDHILYVLDEDGCSQEYNFTIGVYAEPELAFDTYDVCPNPNSFLGALFIMTTELNLEYSLDGTNFSTETDYTDLQEGDYTLYVETADNCVFTYDFSIGTLGLIDIDIDIKNTCAGESNGEINILNATGIEFSMDGNSYLANNSFTDLVAGDYIIYAQDDNLCPTQIPFTIEEVESEELIFTEPFIDCSTEEIMIGLENTSSSDLELSWSNGNQDENIIVSENGIYELSIDDGCSIRTHSWDIKFEDNHLIDVPAFVPNIFSPESEDVNAQFKPLLNEEITLLNYNFSIYDRWGNKLFYSEDNHEFWDGIYMNKPISPGVFVWRVEMEYSSCQESEKFEKYGDVTLIR